MGLVQGGYDDGSLRAAGPAWVVAYGLMGMLGWTNRWFNPADPGASAEEVGAAFADVLLLGLEQRPPGGTAS